ncbi:hypothetical protein BCR32DRAFT_268973 [Anaeromyces robustus]|uniref:Peptidase S8/S53 domain-containing protein n=1 Tax=Anaeromyces robustus TaxID=1754192 RepID=A0A1Y1X367_9FUNG|nr:hypothetical protein BCR32DRAFT_268973 [Anaeromyces robustus]|eukprot:ORX80247.1 hypothetical protein BCR32DRAFT_268973 [Anaeromyces robustus]
MYKGTLDERTITCDAISTNDEIYPTKEEEKYSCMVNENFPDHGIMVSSLAGGTLFGVAKKANIHMIASNLSPISILRGLDYVLQHGTPYKTVISLSVGGFIYNQSENDKLTDLINKGFIVVVAAGNEDIDCCKDMSNPLFHSYTGYRKAIAVGAADLSLQENIYYKTDYSNFGDCVDIYGPGEVTYPNITVNSSITNLYKKGSGTSSAAPLVAGVIASIMSEHPDIEYTNELMKKTIIDMSIKDVIMNLGSINTPNRFINNGKHNIYTPIINNNNNNNNTSNNDNNDFTSNYCGISIESNQKMMCTNGCCTNEGECIRFENHPGEKCLLENGCQEKFGYCTSIEKSIEECENELKEHKECQIDIFSILNEKAAKEEEIKEGEEIEKKFLEFINNFNSKKCKNFYKKQYTNQSICTIAKKYKSFDFIDTFDINMYNQYHNLYEHLLSYYYQDCIGYINTNYGKCFNDDTIDLIYIDDLINDNKDFDNFDDFNDFDDFDDFDFDDDDYDYDDYDNGLEQYEKNNIIQKCVELNSEQCINLYNNTNEIINNYHSCHILNNIYISNDDDNNNNNNPFNISNYIVSNSPNTKLNNNCGTILENSIQKCNKELEKYKECYNIDIDYLSEIDDFELMGKCTILESEKCIKFYNNLHHEIPICSFAEQLQRYEVLENLKEKQDNITYVCQNNIKKEMKEKAILFCHDLFLNGECIFNYNPEWNETELSQKCQIFNSEKCQAFNYNPLMDYPVCLYIQNHYYDEVEYIFSNYYSYLNYDTLICNNDINSIVDECGYALINYKKCLLNNQEIINDKDLQDHCLKFLDKECQEFYENPMKKVPICHIAQNYKSFNIITKYEKNYLIIM